MRGLRALGRRLGGTRARLVGVQVVMLAAAAGIAGASVYQLVASPALAALDSSLADQVHLIAGGLGIVNGTLRYAEAQLPDQGSDGAAIESVVIDREGRVVAASPHQSLAPGAAAAIARQAIDTLGPVSRDVTDDRRARRRVYAEALTLGDSPNPTVVAVVASRSSAAVEDSNRRLLLTLALGSALLVLVGGVIAYLVVSRALRPVGEIAALARTISEQDLHRRVEVRAPDDELGELVRTFNLMLGRLEAIFDSLQRFTADAAHELRAPLSVMRSQVEVALNRRRDPAEYERVLRRVLEQIEHLTRISGQLLLIARADAGQLRPDVERIDVADFVQELEARWRAVAESRGFNLEVEAPDAGDLEADPALFRRVLDNLLDNAARYAPAGSTVRLAARQDGTDWVFSVSDQGPGVPADQRQRIFERFGRADSARTRGQGGAGLGLALGSVIAAAHGGSLEHVDGPGPGATFRLRLPAVQPGGSRAGNPRPGG